MTNKDHFYSISYIGPLSDICNNFFIKLDYPIKISFKIKNKLGKFIKNNKSPIDYKM